VKEGSRLSVLVEDNGKGFDKALPAKQAGAGWTNIRSRIEYLKGHLELSSEPGKGTTVNIELKV
jgi:signal transduction histidine kinase